jgi:hypothetical protein
MEDFTKNKKVTALIVSATVILAAVSIFTAMRLYQLRLDSVEPTDTRADTTIPCTQLAFTLAEEPTPTPEVDITPTVEPSGTITPTPQNTPTLTPTPTEALVGGTNLTPTTTPTPTTPVTPPVSTMTPTPTEAQIGGTNLTPTNTPTLIPLAADDEDNLPQAGLGIPTLIFTFLGIIAVLISFSLAL